jgi:hypothetical protein
MVEVLPALPAGTQQTSNGEGGEEDGMNEEERRERVEHDPVALQKDHDTVAQQQAEKAVKEKDSKPADHAQTDKELAQKRGDAKERKSADPT